MLLASGEDLDGEKVGTGNPDIEDEFHAEHEDKASEEKLVLVFEVILEVDILDGSEEHTGE